MGSMGETMNGYLVKCELPTTGKLPVYPVLFHLLAV